jgi:hypothetical protein
MVNDVSFTDIRSFREEELMAARMVNAVPIEINYYCRACKGHYIGYTDNEHMNAGRVRCKCGATGIHIYSAYELSSIAP